MSQTSEIKLTADGEVRRVSERLHKLSEENKRLLEETGKRIRQTAPGNLGGPPGPDGRNVQGVKTAAGAVHQGMSSAGSEAVPFEQDAEELRSGRFSGIIERRIQGIKTAAETFKKLRGMRKGGSGGQGEGTGENADTSGSSGGHLGGGQSVVRRLRVERLELSPQAARILRGGGRPGAESPFRPAGQGGPVGTPAAGADKLMSGTAGSLSKVQIMGFSIGVIGGIALRTMSSLAGMYQRAYASQDRTLDASRFVTGSSYQRGGGGLVSNAEMAQARLTRAKASASGARTGYAGNLDMKYGLMTNMGGEGGARLFGDLGRYSDGEFSRSDFRSLLRQSYAGGFKKLRSAEFLEGVRGLMEQRVQRGFGSSDIDEIGGRALHLRRKGFSREELFGTMGRIDQQFQGQGSLANSVLIARAMAGGKSYVQAMAQAEQGGTRENLAGVAATLNMRNMDPDTRALLETRIFGVTATQALKGRKKGGLFTDALSPDRTGTNEADSDFSRISRYGGQEHRRVSNKIDQTIVDSGIAKRAFNFQKQFTDKMLDMAAKLDRHAVEGIEQIGKLTAELGKLKKEVEEAGGVFAYMKDKLSPW